MDKNFLLLFAFLVNICQSSFSQNGIPVNEAALLLSKYVQHSSVSGNEKRAGNFFMKLCKEKGLHINLFNEEANCYNFSASLYPLHTNKPNIILLNHIDVVPANDSSKNWKYPPFSGKIDSGMVWGRGAIDNKGMAIMQLMAVAELVDLANTQDLEYNVTILSVSDEETGGELGAKLVTENHFNELNPVVVLGEGGSGLSQILSSNPNKKMFGIEIDQKNRLWLQLQLQVSSPGQGAVPPKEYSNKLMIRSLNRLVRRNPKIVITKPAKIMFKEIGKQEKGLRKYVLQHINFFKPVLASYLRKDPIILSTITNTIAITNISNPSSSFNQIPQSTTVNLDCRLLPGTDEERFINKIKRKLKDDNIDIKSFSIVKNAKYYNKNSVFY
jgi:carboxypeptidase PM20D1